MAIGGSRQAPANQEIYNVLFQIKESMIRQEALLKSIYGHPVEEKGTGLYSVAKSLSEIRKMMESERGSE